MFEVKENLFLTDRPLVRTGDIIYTKGLNYQGVGIVDKIRENVIYLIVKHDDSTWKQTGSYDAFSALQGYRVLKENEYNFVFNLS